MAKNAAVNSSASGERTAARRYMYCANVMGGGIVVQGKTGSQASIEQIKESGVPPF